jgi:hypothetical protein
VLVSLVLVPLFLAILQLGLDLYVRNTLAACAQNAARQAADADVDALGTDAVQQTAQDVAGRCIDAALSRSLAGHITGRTMSMSANGAAPLHVIEVDVVAPLPMVGFLGLGNMRLRVSGHALEEQP